jgi:ABC-type transporter Mla maintaining outer membrane lipid asymmetry ATPase subunit MlaF
VTPALVEFAGVSKGYGGLRPLRVADLRVGAGEQVAILGFDQPSAEVFVNLATGATLPDAGEVRLFGRPTSAIADSADWLSTIDRIGIVSDRAVLLEQLTVVQNLAIPFTLQIEPPPDAERARAAALAREVGIGEASWDAALSSLDVTVAARVRVGRAIALDPAVVLLEHASARVPRAAVAALGAGIRRLAERRGLAVVAVTADHVFATAVAPRVLTLEPATGRLRERGRGWW